MRGRSPAPHAAVQPAGARAGDEVLQAYVAHQHADRQTAEQKKPLPAIFFCTQQSVCRQQPAPPLLSSVSFGMRKSKNGQVRTSRIQCRMLQSMLMRDPLLSCRESGLHSPAQQLQPQQDRHAQQERGRVKGHKAHRRKRYGQVDRSIHDGVERTEHLPYSSTAAPHRF